MMNERVLKQRVTRESSLTGKWIAFLDSDDEWLHDSIALRLQVAENGNLQVFYAECYRARRPAHNRERCGLPPLEGFVYKGLLEKARLSFRVCWLPRSASNGLGH